MQLIRHTLLKVTILEVLHICHAVVSGSKNSYHVDITQELKKINFTIKETAFDRCRSRSSVGTILKHGGKYTEFQKCQTKKIRSFTPLFP